MMLIVRTTSGDKPQTHTTRANEYIEPFDSSRCANYHSIVLVPHSANWTVFNHYGSSALREPPMRFAFATH